MQRQEEEDWPQTLERSVGEWYITTGSSLANFFPIDRRIMGRRLLREAKFAKPGSHDCMS